MSNEMMDLAELASYLHRDVREVNKLASRGHLPGQKVAGQWRFARAEINHWLETQLHAFDEKQLSALETTQTHEPDGGLTDIFFLVCCRDDRTHLKVLARLSRLLLRPGFVESLRNAETATQTWQVIAAAELELLETPGT